MKPWNIVMALELIRALQPLIRQFNYHLCLGGSVLNKGESQKDLDLYFLPMGDCTKIQPDKLKELLDGLWGAGRVLGGRAAQIEAARRQVYDQSNGLITIMENEDYAADTFFTHRLKYTYSNEYRIDVFIV